MCSTTWLVCNRQNQVHVVFREREGQLPIDSHHLLNIQTGNAIQQCRDSLPRQHHLGLYFSALVILAHLGKGYCIR